MAIKNTLLGGSDMNTPSDRLKPTDWNDTFDAVANQLKTFDATDFNDVAGEISIDDTNTVRTVVAGEGIDVSSASGNPVISGEDATTTNKGIASFNTNDFSVSSGAVKSSPILDWDYTSFALSNIPDTGSNISIGQIIIPAGRTALVVVKWDCEIQIETNDEGVILTTKRDATQIGNDKTPYNEIGASTFVNVFPGFTHAEVLTAGTYNYTIFADPTTGNNNSDLANGDCTILAYPVT